MTRQIILDTETTGLSVETGHRIIEIGCVELINRKMTGQQYHQYINPERAVDEGAFAVHGLSNTFLEDKPVFASVVQDFMAFVDGAEVIIHNAPFDVKFINHELSVVKQKWRALTDHCRVTDTLVMARQLHVGQRNSLDALCRRYHIDNTHRELHGALLDAHLLGLVYLAMTGGQGSLFDLLDEPVTQEGNGATTEQQAPMVKRQRNGFILKATEEELAAHGVWF